MAVGLTPSSRPITLLVEPVSIHQFSFFQNGWLATRESWIDALELFAGAVALAVGHLEGADVNEHLSWPTHQEL